MAKIRNAMPASRAPVRECRSPGQRASPYRARLYWRRRSFILVWGRDGFVDGNAGVANCLQPLLRIFLEAAPYQSADRKRRAGWEQRPVRLGFEDGGERVGNAFAGEGPLCCQHFIEQAAESPDV